MEYEANDCFIKNGLGIDSSNASELEGKTVAVPLNTMADFAFRSYMSSLNVDTSTMTIVDQAPADGAKSLADGNVDMACIFGGNSSKAAAFDELPPKIQAISTFPSAKDFAPSAGA